MEKVRVTVTTACVGLALILGGASPASAASSARAVDRFRPLPLPHRAAWRMPVATTRRGITPSLLQCVSKGSPAHDVKLDCDTLLPNNEPHIAVDPTDAKHQVGSSNDYDQCCDAFYTTFNAGNRWRSGDMSVEPPGGRKRTGSDPVSSFDRRHQVVLHSSLNFLNDGCDGDVVVSISKRGLHWPQVVEVADGGGPTNCENHGLFNDKEWITTDNNPSSPFYGRSYVTWTAFHSRHGATLSDPIRMAYSDDGGLTWSAPQTISGSNAALCTVQTAGPAGQCDEDQFSVPAVAPDGTLYVSFINGQNAALSEPGEVGDDQYLVVRSTDGGISWSKPVQIAALEDGSRDLPINVDGRQTLTGYQLRAPETGNIVADPTEPGRLYFAFFDNRNGVHDSDHPVSSTDVFLTRSTNDGASWSAPVRVNAGGGGAGNDQWWPSVDVSPTDGTVGVLYLDRSYDASHRTYQATLSTSRDHGLTFTSQRVSRRASHPRRSIFFQAHAKGCWNCTTFDGDYIWLTYGIDGVANAVWTDMRRQYHDSGLYLQFIRYARR